MYIIILNIIHHRHLYFSSKIDSVFYLLRILRPFIFFIPTKKQNNLSSRNIHRFHAEKNCSWNNFSFFLRTPSTPVHHPALRLRICRCRGTNQDPSMPGARWVSLFLCVIFVFPLDFSSDATEFIFSSWLCQKRVMNWVTHHIFLIASFAFAEEILWCALIEHL